MPPPQIEFSVRPYVILIVGVNGSGKTTNMAKLGQRFINTGKNVIFGAGDTYRAAAVDQLQIWGKRLNIPVISGQQNGDPGAVTYDTVQAAIARGYDIVLIDNENAVGHVFENGRQGFDGRHNGILAVLVTL